MRLGNSGLKVSRIILGCMSYGTPEWEKWVLGEEESLKIIKAAYVCHFAYLGSILNHRAPNSYDAGINTFDTANVWFCAVSSAGL